MGRLHPAFSAVAASAEWFAEASAWVSAAVAERGGRVVAVERGRVRPWSAQLVVAAVVDDSPVRLWFKANCRAQAFEPALQRELSRLAPDLVDAPIAIDAHRGWMLTADRGATLRERREPTAEDWTGVIDAWTRMQRRTALAGERFLALGVPDCAPATVPARYERMLERLGALSADHPSFLDREAAGAFAKARTGVALAAEVLESSGLPPALQHGDLHPGNVFAPADGGLRVFDFGDAQWAHPVEALLVPLAVMEHAGLDDAAAAEAFRRGWAGAAAFDDVEWSELLVAARVAHGVNRAETWWDCLVEANGDETAEWGEAVLRHLERVLEPRPAR